MSYKQTSRMADSTETTTDTDADTSTPMSDDHSTTTARDARDTTAREAEAVYNALADDKWASYDSPDAAEHTEPSRPTDTRHAPSSETATPDDRQGTAGAPAAELDADTHGDTAAEDAPTDEHADLYADGIHIETNTTDSSDVAAALDTIGVKPATGERVVASVAAQNGSAANDAKTPTGIGQESGVWGKSFIHADGALLPRPAGSTAVAEERIAGEQLELDSINNLRDRFAIPERCACGTEVTRFDDRFECTECEKTYATREELIARAEQRVDDTRTHWQVTDSRGSRVSLGTSYYSEDIRPQDSLPEDINLAPAHRKYLLASAQTEPNHTFDPDHVQTPGAEPGTVAAEGAHSGRRMACPYADETRDEPAPTIYPDDLEALDERIAARKRRATRQDALERALFGNEDSRGIVDHFRPNAYSVTEDTESIAVTRRQMTLERLERRVDDILVDCDTNVTNTIMAAQKALFHETSQPLSVIKPYWTACTAKVTVERLYDPASKSQRLVAKVTDASPLVDATSTGSDSAKLTIWSRANIDDDHPAFHTDIMPGDELLLQNVIPSEYRGQLTLAVTSDSHITRTAPNTDYNGAHPSFDTHNYDYSPQDRAALESNPTVERIPVPRYRRVAKTNTERLGIHESPAAQGPGEERYRNSMWTLMTEHYPTESVPAWFREENTNLARQFTAADFQAEAPASGPEYQPISAEGFDAHIDSINAALPTSLTPLETSLTTERVYEASDAPTNPDHTLRVYSSVVGEWSSPNGENSILVTIEASDGDLVETETLHRTSDATRWQDRLLDTIADCLDIDIDGGIDIDADAEAAADTDGNGDAADTDTEPVPSSTATGDTFQEFEVSFE